MGPDEPGRALVRMAIFVAALVVVPAVFGVVTWLIAATLTGDADTAPSTSTIPEDPTPTIAVPGGLVVVPGTGGGGPGVPVPSVVPTSPVPGLPPGWPDALRPPPGSTIRSSIANGGTLVLSYGSDQEAAALADQLRLQLVSGGFTITNELRASDGSSATVQGESDSQRAVVSIAPSPTPDQPPRLVNVILNPR